MSFKYPLATTTWDDDEYAAINRVVESGMFTMGPKVMEFEERFAEWQGSKYAVMVNSGSSANLLMIAALFYTKNDKYKLNAGDEILVPAVSWSTTYFPASQYGLKLKFVDIDLMTLNFDIEALEKAISDKTKAIFAVNILGNPNNYSRIKKLVDGRNIFIIEDNCESMGAKFNGLKCGSFGLMGSFSTFFSHHISTMEGGLIATDDEELYHIMLSLRAHGWTRNLPKHNCVTGVKSDDPFEESFKFVLPGYNLRPLEMSGAIGIEQVKKLPTLIDRRRQNAERFVEAMQNHPEFMIQQEIGESSWFGFSLVIRPGVKTTRRQLVDRLNVAGFECRPIVTGNFTRNPVMEHMRAELSGEMQNADHINDYGVFIGNHHYDMKGTFQIIKNL